MSTLHLYRQVLSPDAAHTDAQYLGGFLPAEVMARISPLHALAPLSAPTSCGFGGSCFATCMAYQGLGSQHACKFLCGTQPQSKGPVVTRPLLPPHLRGGSGSGSGPSVGGCLRQCTETRDPTSQARCAAGCAAITGAPLSQVDPTTGCVKFCLGGCPKGPGFVACAKECALSCTGQEEEMPITHKQPTLFR